MADFEVIPHADAELARRMFATVVSRHATELKKRGITLCKPETVRHILGCTPAQLLARMRRLRVYYEDIADHNYGSLWSIDHDQPIATADLADPAIRATVFHISNLWPLHNTDNTSKPEAAHGTLDRNRLLPKRDFRDEICTDGKLDLDRVRLFYKI